MTPLIFLPNFEILLGHFSTRPRGLPLFSIPDMYDSSKERQQKVLKVSKKIFIKKVFQPKSFKKPLILAIIGRKNAKTKIFLVEKIFLGGIDSEWSKAYLKRKSRFRKKIPVVI